METCRVIAITNQKSGVGKTTSTVKCLSHNFNQNIEAIRLCCVILIDIIVLR